MRKILLLFLAVLMLGLTSCDRHVVSEKVWKKAFTLESFSNVTFIIINGENEKENCDKVTIKVDDGKYFYLTESIYDESKGFEETSLVYYETDPDGYSWEYYKDPDGEWTKHLASNRALDIFANMFETLESAYQFFEYDKSIHTYIAKDGGEYTVLFEDNKVVKITEIEHNNTYSYEFIDYGKTVVELPIVE